MYCATLYERMYVQDATYAWKCARTVYVRTHAHSLFRTHGLQNGRPWGFYHNIFYPVQKNKSSRVYKSTCGYPGIWTRGVSILADPDLIF